MPQSLILSMPSCNGKPHCCTKPQQQGAKPAKYDLMVIISTTSLSRLGLIIQLVAFSILKSNFGFVSPLCLDIFCFHAFMSPLKVMRVGRGWKWLFKYL